MRPDPRVRGTTRAPDSPQLTCIDSGLVVEGEGGGFDERRHEAEFQVVFLQEGVFVQRPHLLDVTTTQTCAALAAGPAAPLPPDQGHRPHVHLIEGGQHGAGVLSLLQPLCDSLPHPIHLYLGGGSVRVRTRPHKVYDQGGSGHLPCARTGLRETGRVQGGRTSASLQTLRGEYGVSSAAIAPFPICILPMPTTMPTPGGSPLRSGTYQACSPRAERTQAALEG